MYRFEHISNIRDDLVELISLIERIRVVTNLIYLATSR